MILDCFDSVVFFISILFQVYIHIVTISCTDLQFTDLPIAHLQKYHGALVVVIAWLLDLQLHMQSVPVIIRSSSNSAYVPDTP